MGKAGLNIITKSPCVVTLSYMPGNERAVTLKTIFLMMLAVTHVHTVQGSCQPSVSIMGSAVIYLVTLT